MLIKVQKIVIFLRFLFYVFTYVLIRVKIRKENNEAKRFNKNTQEK